MAGTVVVPVKTGVGVVLFAVVAGCAIAGVVVQVLLELGRVDTCYPVA